MNYKNVLIKSSEPNQQFMTRENKKTNNFKINKNKPFNIIFSFAGGGTDGIGSLEILKVISEKLEKRNKNINLIDILYNKNTIIAGTSTGSIITALLKNNNRIDPNTNKKYTIDGFQQMYKEISPKLFSPFSIETFSRIVSCCFISPFSREPLVNAANRYLGTQKVKDSPGLVIMTFNKSKNKSELIAMNNKNNYEYTISDSAQASAAIPCAFSPKIINEQSYSDGGSCLVNLHPTLEALRHYKKLRKDNGYSKSEEFDFEYINDNKFYDQVLIVDIGAGTAGIGKKCSCISKNNWGGILATLFDGTCCECMQHIQRSGPEIVQEMIDEETFNIQLFQFDFQMQFPLEFRQSGLEKTKQIARNAVLNNPKIDELVDILENFTI